MSTFSSQSSPIADRDCWGNRTAVGRHSDVLVHRSDCLLPRYPSAGVGTDILCAIVCTIVSGHMTGQYPSSPAKPADLVGACGALESETSLPQDFIDGSLVVVVARWVMAELVHVLRGLSCEDARRLVDDLAERRLPLVWKSQQTRRVLDPKMRMRDQILVLLSSVSGKVSAEDLYRWTEYNWASWFEDTLISLHRKRLI
jgi:hypothetical protein